MRILHSCNASCICLNSSWSYGANGFSYVCEALSFCMNSPRCHVASLVCLGPKLTLSRSQLSLYRWRVFNIQKHETLLSSQSKLISLSQTHMFWFDGWGGHAVMHKEAASLEVVKLVHHASSSTMRALQSPLSFAPSSSMSLELSVPYYFPSHHCHHRCRLPLSHSLSKMLIFGKMPKWLIPASRRKSSLYDLLRKPFVTQN